jgi:hypothetical protein
LFAFGVFVFWLHVKYGATAQIIAFDRPEWRIADSSRDATATSVSFWQQKKSHPVGMAG